MKRLLRFTSVMTFVVCIILLADFTAPNPTGRRYASEPYQTVTAGGRTFCDGTHAETLIARDLSVERNDLTGRQCVCGLEGTPQSACQCIARSALLTNVQSRIPDYVTNSYIGESKCRTMITDERLQLAAFADAAKQLGRPLWLFVRLDTQVSAPMASMVRSTGGDVVRYLVPQGHIDPVDVFALIGLIGSAFVFIAYRKH